MEKSEIDALKEKVAELEAKLEGERDDTKDQAPASTTTGIQPIFLTQGRRLEVFKGKPVKPGDPTVQDWIIDMKSQLAVRNLGTSEQAAFVRDHLGGNARREILGRGDAVAEDVKEIFATLEKVFGSGDSLPVQLQKFFSYQQAPAEGLLECSLQLVTLYDRICFLDGSYKGSKTETLKGRLAETVCDEGLRRELRRLNTESPDLDFFELRDRALNWFGLSRKPKAATLQETSTSEKASILDILKRQGDLLEKQQRQIEALTAERSSRPRITCYYCGKTGHIQRQCKKRMADLNRANEGQAITKQPASQAPAEAPKE
ncbi:uncharacterized protein [Diadema setosum]|uniref:uncharacterized protein n=1 Tax=Diadema setosum TaxID=31175 RepID=UPI003B3A5A91